MEQRTPLPSPPSRRDLEKLIDGCRYIDAHTHSDQYAGSDKEEMIRQTNLLEILTLGSAMDPSSIRDAFALNRRCPLILTAAGIHPARAGIVGLRELEEAEEYYARAVQISEIGLDTVWVPPEATLPLQEELFVYQLDLAIKHDKPATLHTKGAEERIIEILTERDTPSLLIHWFAGTPRQADVLLDRGCYFTVPPEILNDSYDREMIKRIPAERLLPETDNPPTWPWLFGAPAEASQITGIYDEAARLLGLPDDELAALFKDNLKAFLLGI